MSMHLELTGSYTYVDPAAAAAAVSRACAKAVANEVGALIVDQAARANGARVVVSYRGDLPPGWWDGICMFLMELSWDARTGESRGRLSEQGESEESWYPARRLPPRSPPPQMVVKRKSSPKRSATPKTKNKAPKKKGVAVKRA